MPLGNFFPFWSYAIKHAERVSLLKPALLPPYFEFSSTHKSNLSMLINRREPILTLTSASRAKRNAVFLPIPPAYSWNSGIDNNLLVDMTTSSFIFPRNSSDRRHCIFPCFMISSLYTALFIRTNPLDQCILRQRVKPIVGTKFPIALIHFRSVYVIFVISSYR